jgi:hypothetical protein
MGTDPTMINEIQTLAKENAFIDFIRVTLRRLVLP